MSDAPPDTTVSTTAAPQRRAVLRGMAAAGVLAASGAALAACGGDNGGTTAGGGTGTTTGTSSPSPTASTGTGTGGGAAGGTVLARTSDVPVGGGVLVKAENVVVTQPTAGQFKAFSARCTHRSCVVGSPEGGSVVCPCHGSKFSLTDGSPQNGPATAPLPPVEVTVANGEIRKV